MTTPTISNLRYRAWQLANKAIDTINNLNDVIFENSPNKPPRVGNKQEDTNNINLQYIQDGVDLFNSYLYEINHKRNYLISLHEKNNECKNALTQLIV